MYDYALYFLVTLVVTTIFAMGGVGGAIALVSIYPMMGQNFNLAKAMALFVNTTTMASISFMNFKRKVLDFKFAMPLVISVLISTPIGSYASQFVDHTILKWCLSVFLVIMGTLLVFGKKKAQTSYQKTWVLYALGVFVGLLSGFLGIGGGGIIMAALIMLGFEPKKAAYAVSFVIPFSTSVAFLTYLNFVEINWYLLLDITIASILGGYIGGRIMHFNLSQMQIKRFLGIILYIISIKMISSLL